MTPHGRRYGVEESRPIPVWNGVLEHRRKIKSALWEFLWCLDRITKEENGIGLVLGGSPVKIGKIANSLDEDEKTVRDNLASLEKNSYITRRRTPYGYVIGILNSKKFEIWRSKETGEKARPDRKKGPVTPEQTPVLTGEKARNKEDAAVDAAKEAAAGRSAAWKFLGVDGSRWAPTIREVCENLYGARSGQTPVELVGACMDGIEALGERIPPALARRAAELRSQNRVSVGEPIPELEAEPWAR